MTPISGETNPLLPLLSEEFLSSQSSPHVIYQQFFLALTSKYIQDPTFSLHLYYSHSDPRHLVFCLDSFNSPPAGLPASPVQHGSQNHSTHQMPQQLPTPLRWAPKPITLSPGPLLSCSSHPQTSPDCSFWRSCHAPCHSSHGLSTPRLRLFARAAPAFRNAFLLHIYLVHLHFVEIFARTYTSSLWPFPLLYFSFCTESPTRTCLLSCLLEHQH